MTEQVSQVPQVSQVSAPSLPAAVPPPPAARHPTTQRAHDERPLRRAAPPPESAEGGGGTPPPPSPEPLAESARLELGGLISLWGERNVAGAYSKRWATRRAALEAMAAAIPELWARVEGGGGEGSPTLSPAALLQVTNPPRQ